MASRTGCSFFDVRNSADCFESVSIKSAAQRAMNGCHRESKRSGEYVDVNWNQPSVRSCAPSLGHRLDAVTTHRKYGNGELKVTCGLAFGANPGDACPLSTVSSYAESTVFSNADVDPDEPFDTSRESERLMKIHDLAEQIMASEAASRNVATAEADGTSSRLNTSGSTTPSAQTSRLKTLSESPLMPLAEAANNTVRACIASTLDESTSKRKTPTGNISKHRPGDVDTSPRASGSLFASAADPPRGASSSPVSSQQSRGRRRKQVAPFKSPTADDPTFKGAVVHMRLQMVRGQPQLKMEHYYNNMQRRRMMRPDYAELSESEDDFEFARKDYPEQKGKQCASCATRLTPLWRDAEDGTPLCNACGIRYKKYKVRCSHCWHIPRKNENTRNNCKECGGTLRFMLRKSFA